MASTTYDSTVAVALAMMKTLRRLLAKAQASPSSATLLEARLAPDMYTLCGQVRVATTFAERMAAKLAGRAPVVHESDPASWDECCARVDAVIEALSSGAAADREAVNARADVVESTEVAKGFQMEVSGAAYAHTMCLPNIYFHTSTAYGILRKEGLQIGKKDFIHGFWPQPE